MRLGSIDGVFPDPLQDVYVEGGPGSWQSNVVIRRAVPSRARASRADPPQL